MTVFSETVALSKLSGEGIIYFFQLMTTTF